MHEQQHVDNMRKLATSLLQSVHRGDKPQLRPFPASLLSLLSRSPSSIDGERQTHLPYVL